MRGLLYLALLVFLLVIASRLLQAWRRDVRVPRAATRDELVKDPVCQTYILLSRSITSEVNGVVTHFCSRECAARFARGERAR
jgi:YHS domain-containing protein